MERRYFAVSALVATLAICAAENATLAQSGMKSRIASKSPSPVEAVPTPSSRLAPQHNGQMTSPGLSEYQEYPDNYQGGYGSEHYGMPGNYGSCGCDDGYGACGCDECCDYGCSGGCDSGCGNSWYDCCGFESLFCVGQPNRWFFTADYLHVRANFSEAPAYLVHVDNNPTFSDTFKELDFQHESSFRVGGGYNLGCCDEHVRFLYTRMSSFADDSVTGVGNTIAGPFETSPGPGGELNIRADVDTKSWDVEFAKTIPLGGCNTCGCADACGCGHSCPSWDLTWQGGVRFASVDWSRFYDSSNEEADPPLFRTAQSTMSFDGAGPRFGLEGRRYFGQKNWFSAYLKGDISLLLGHVQVDNVRVDQGEDEEDPDVVNTQTARFRNIIPVTEIETGLSSQVTCNSMVSCGYLFSAWHDLGFRDQFAFATFLETNYDDANILGFDGFFARLEVSY